MNVPRRRLIVLSACLAAALLLGMTLFLVTARIKMGSFKTFAETKVSEFLKAKVRIGKIRPRFLNQVALSELAIGGQNSEFGSYFVHVDKIIFRYDFLQLLTQNFRDPKSIILEAPRMIFKESEFPAGLFQGLRLEPKGKGISPSSLTIKGGEIQIKVPSLKSELGLSNIQGSVVSLASGIKEVSLRGRASGLFSGDVRIQGTMDTVRQIPQLVFDLESVKLDEKIPLPFERLNGRVRIQGNSIYLEDIRTTIHGWDTHIAGMVRNFSKAPAFNLDFRIGRQKPLGQFKLAADLAQGSMNGSFKIESKLPVDFQGKIRQEGSKFIFNSVKTNTGYEGNAAFDFQSGNSSCDFHRDRQEVRVSTDLRRFNFDLFLNFNHVNVFGLDLVALGRIRLSPMNLHRKEEGWKFHADFGTEYFVLEYTPFENFKGDFDLVPYELKNLNASWGNDFAVDGRIALKSNRPEAHMSLQVRNFDLKTVQEFAAKPLPKNLGGTLEGKMKIEGPLDRPEVTGNFNVKKGVIGKLQYDKGIIQFRGFPPYLALYDSHILKGRSTLQLTGALDLALPNMFNGIAIETSEKFLIWKGWEINTSRAEGDLELDRSSGKLPILTFGGRENKTGTVTDQSRGNEDQQYIGVGPKIKF